MVGAARRFTWRKITNRQSQAILTWDITLDAPSKEERQRLQDYYTGWSLVVDGVVRGAVRPYLGATRVTNKEPT